MPGTRGEFDRSLEAIEAKVIQLFDPQHANRWRTRQLPRPARN